MVNHKAQLWKKTDPGLQTVGFRSQAASVDPHQAWLHGSSEPCPSHQQQQDQECPKNAAVPRFFGDISVLVQKLSWAYPHVTALAHPRRGQGDTTHRTVRFVPFKTQNPREVKWNLIPRKLNSPSPSETFILIPPQPLPPAGHSAGAHVECGFASTRKEALPGDELPPAATTAAAHAPSNHLTESQHGRGWKGPLWVTQSNPPAEAGSPRAGCTGPCPGRS